LALRAGFDGRAARAGETGVVMWEWRLYFYFWVQGRCARRGGFGEARGLVFSGTSRLLSRKRRRGRWWFGC